MVELVSTRKYIACCISRRLVPPPLPNGNVLNFRCGGTKARMCVRLLAILIDGFRGFPQFLLTNARLVSCVGQHSTSLSTHHYDLPISFETLQLKLQSLRSSRYLGANSCSPIQEAPHLLCNQKPNFRVCNGQVRLPILSRMNRIPSYHLRMILISFHLCLPL